MSNFEITNNDSLKIELFNALYDENSAEYTFTGAGTLAAGTVLGIITATGKYAQFMSGNSDGTEIPKAIITYDVVASGAGDVAIRPLIGGEVNGDALVFDGTDTLETLVSGNKVKTHLRDYGIIARDGVQIDVLDNQ